MYVDKHMYDRLHKADLITYRPTEGNSNLCMKCTVKRSIILTMPLFCIGS